MTGPPTGDVGGAATVLARVAALVTHEVVIAYRYRILHAAVFVTVLWMVLIAVLPSAALPIAVPLLLFTEAATMGLFFVAGLAMFERDEGTDRALDVSPARYQERLSSRLAVLTALAVVAGLAIAASGWAAGLPEPPHPLAVTAGVALAALVVLLVGHLTATRVDTVTDYVIAVQLPLAPLALPLLDHLGWVESPLWWLLPTHGSLVLLGGAVEGLPPLPVTTAAVAVPVIWIAALAAIAARTRRRAMR